MYISTINQLSKCTKPFVIKKEVDLRHQLLVLALDFKYKLYIKPALYAIKLHHTKREGNNQYKKYSNKLNVAKHPLICFEKPTADRKLT